MKTSGWKILCVVLLLYTAVAGLLLDVPRLNIVNETIRALYFHVPMWFGMVFLFSMSLWHAIRYLRNPSIETDIHSFEYATVGLVFGVLGIITGMIWANYTWGSPWHGDPKQNSAAIALLVYLAYFILRGSLSNDEQRAKLSAVYNVFAFVAMIPLLFIIPRMTSSMHPGNGGNPGFNAYDLDSKMRLVFYPAVIGWILLGYWIASLRIRLKLAEEKLNELEHEKNS
ncbi:MAG: Cytochrome c-type biogenesis protein CcmC, putative heme lyase for CcmE [Cytophagales bacterium]|jgi:heme exporter protein C|nr:cytochrome c biogenesis protein CcsA [Bacteroidota bacterium]MBS1982322.1 cytochrome c biogenesis protein CcsA [Bacteroidota bacterium]WHZ07578.1 MAG: Cytochrome c-type biogenesis protein CcmC, putative heme lyase for CcmE [Cytophagales bacterium]